MQKQEIPPFALRHSGCDLVLNQLVVLQAIRRPPWRRYECSLNSWGPLGPLSTVTTWWVATAPVHTNRAVISRCANQRAAGVRFFCFLYSAASCLVHRGSSHVWLLFPGWPLDDHCEGSSFCPQQFAVSASWWLLSFIAMAQGKCWYKNNLWCDYLGEKCQDT